MTETKTVSLTDESLIAELTACLSGIKWKSADRDNMEFSARVTTWQLDAIKEAISRAEGRLRAAANP